jgi:ubiquinone/menaquinone biosynthesis C-methylase UbiE
MDDMTKHRPMSDTATATDTVTATDTATAAEDRHDYLPAAGHDALLPFYDLFTAALGVARVHRTLVDQAQLADGQQVLEIGCGTGKLSVRAKRARPGIQLIGSDPDPRALAVARRKARGLKGISFERAYAQRLPYPDATFDRVLSSLMLHHLDDDTKAVTAAEIQRVLRPGGSLHLVDFTQQVQTHGAHNIHALLSRRMLKSGHVAHSGGEDIVQLLTAAGLECTRTASRRHPVMGPYSYFRATRPR